MEDISEAVAAAPIALIYVRDEANRERKKNDVIKRKKSVLGESVRTFIKSIKMLNDADSSTRL
jgi:hypothetical protein